MKRIPVIIDCDPGHDDMMAIVLACGNEKLDVRAITTVAGNKDLEKVTQNALNVMNLIGKPEIPVAKGLPYNMVRDYGWAERIRLMPQRPSDEIPNEGGVHGKTGLDGFTFPEENPLQVVDYARSVEMIAKVVRESEEKITLIPTGPLTNIGLFIRSYPDLLPKIEKISLMGGTCRFIFTKPFMEFNTYMDPEATKIVFESGIPIVMYGYDVTYTALYNQAIIDRVAAIGNKTSEMVSSLLQAFRTMHNSNIFWLDMGEYCPIHDACAVAGIIDPTVIKKSQKMRVDIEVGGSFLDGATVCDFENYLPGPKNVEVVQELYNDRFFDMFMESIKNLA